MCKHYGYYKKSYTHMKAIILIFISTLITLNSTTKVFGHNILIPKIGDTSSKYMSISQENKLGDIIYSQILGSLNLVNDPLVTSYVQNLGNKLLISEQNNSINYRFLVADNLSINAFATPGGIIVINSGVILHTNSEAELASVIAHEIAHVKARHLSRMYEKSSKVDITTALTVLTTIIAGIYDSSTIGGTYIAGQGINAQKQINFMRENEKEADRLAINILANANINPKAMSNFFRTLLKKNNEDGAIEWLRTHPLTKNRIIETEILSSKYKGKFVDDSFTYQFVSAKISMDNIDTRKFISGYKYKKNEAYNTPSKVIDHYAYGLALTEEKKYIKAINVFENLLSILNTKDKLNTVKNYISIALANAHIKNNDFKKSLTILENLNNIYPTNNSILYYLSNAYINTKDYRRT